MKNTLNIIISLIIIAAFFACETDITVDLPKPEDKLIVEGRIEKGKAPYVFLSNNMGYFEEINLSGIEDSNFNTNEIIPLLEESIGLVYDSSVIVTVDNGSVKDTLKPSFLFDFPYFGYVGNSSVLTGQTGQTYKLEIYYNNNYYWSETMIPQPIDIDSVWFTFPEDRDTLGYLHFLFEDPQSVRNFYSLELQTVDEQITYYPPFFGTYAFDDEGVDGDTIRYTPLSKGYDGNDFFQQEFESQEDFDEAQFHEFGSEVNIKLSTIDKELFIFWDSYFRHLATAGNPFTNPVSLKTNINGDNADGYWGGYGSSITNVTIDSSLIRK